MPVYLGIVLCINCPYTSPPYDATVTPPLVRVIIYCQGLLLALRELLVLYCGWVWCGASVMCRCAWLLVYLCPLPHTHTATTHSLRHTTTCPRQRSSVIVLLMPLRAPGLVLWLGVAGCTSVVSVCMFVCLSVLVVTYSHIHHSAHTPRHRLSLSAFLCGCLGNVSASS